MNGDLASVGRTAMFDRFRRRGRDCLGTLHEDRSQAVHSQGGRRSPSSSTRRCRSPRPRWRCCTWGDLLLRRAFARPALRNSSVGVAAVMSSTSDGEPWQFHVRFRTLVERRGLRRRSHVGARTEGGPRPSSVGVLACRVGARLRAHGIPDGRGAAEGGLGGDGCSSP